MCFNIVTLDMILIFNFRAIIEHLFILNTFLKMKIAENEENIYIYLIFKAQKNNTPFFVF